MSRSVIVQKIPITRKREKVGIASNVRVVVQPKSNKSIILRPGAVKNLVIPTLKQNSPPPPPPSPKPNCKGRSQIVKKVRTPRVLVKTADPSPESLARIRSLRNAGSHKVLLIIGNGPSINEVELDRLKNHPRIDILSINKPDPRLWPTTYWSFFDASQYRRHKELWDSYNGIIFNSTAISQQKARSIQFKYISGKGFSRDLINGLHIGRSSVFASMQIALWMNYDYVYCFGVDMNPDGINGKLHFFGVNPDVNPELRKKRFINEAGFYEHAASLLSQEERNRFVFCSSYNHHNFVDMYRRIDHKVAVDHILNGL